MKTEDLDRIHSMGFWVTIDWNLCFAVDYPSPGGDSINILVCSYETMSPSITFSDVMQQCVDIFYEWYNDNRKRIDKMSKEEMEEAAMGNITKRVRRNLNLDKLL
jgi:hypothetical protein